MARAEMQTKVTEDLKPNIALGWKVVVARASVPVGGIHPPLPILRPRGNLTLVISTHGNPALARQTCAVLTHLTLAGQTLIILKAMEGQRLGKGIMRTLLD